MGVYVLDDVGVNNCGFSFEIYSVEEACQRVRFILMTQKGSFIYNRNFGADFSPLLNTQYDEKYSSKLAELLCREALAEQKEITIQNVSCEITSKGKYCLKMDVIFQEQAQALEVIIN